MLILLFIIFLGFFISGILVYSLTEKGKDNLYSYLSMLLGGLCLVGVLCVTVLGGVEISKARTIENKIVMYQEENSTIENNITRMVEKYLEHEENIYEGLQGEDIEVLLVVYPEIKSDELVSYQMKVFTENNKKIKKLKEEKFNIDIWRFWVYFG